MIGKMVTFRGQDATGNPMQGTVNSVKVVEQLRSPLSLDSGQELSLSNVTGDHGGDTRGRRRAAGQRAGDEHRVGRLRADETSQVGTVKRLH